MIDKKIANRLKRHGFDEWGIKLLTPIIKSLFKEYAMEIIGEDTPRVDIEPQDTFTQRMAEAHYKNMLRAEQREKLLTEDKK